jgi:hypothetical protein
MGIGIIRRGMAKKVPYAATATPAAITLYPNGTGCDRGQRYPNECKPHEQSRTDHEGDQAREDDARGAKSVLLDGCESMSGDIVYNNARSKGAL